LSSEKAQFGATKFGAENSHFGGILRRKIEEFLSTRDFLCQKCAESDKNCNFPFTLFAHDAARDGRTNRRTDMIVETVRRLWHWSYT